MQTCEHEDWELTYATNKENGICGKDKKACTVLIWSLGWGGGYFAVQGNKPCLVRLHPKVKSVVASNLIMLLFQSKA